MEIERVEIAKLVGDPANARKHGERNITSIVASLTRFGQQKPIVIDKANVVRAGNGTLEAARSLGWTHLDCVRTPLDGSDAIAYAIADNRTAELAEWDTDVLAATLEGLNLEGMLDVTGFDQSELDALLEEVGAELTEPDADTIPEMPEGEPITQVGDLWVLGDHWLLCGDSTAADTRNMICQSADLQIVDPPFDLDYFSWSLCGSPKIVMVWQRGVQALKWEAATLADEYGCHELVFTGGVRGWPNDWFPCTTHDTVRMWRNERAAKKFDASVLRESGCRTIQDGTRPFSVQEHAGGVLTGYGGMSWGKALVAMEIAMAYVARGETVFDPCAGSGTSLIAAAKHGRKWRGLELQPKWCDLIAKRYEDQIGETPQRIDAKQVTSYIAGVTGAVTPVLPKQKRTKKESANV